MTDDIVSVLEGQAGTVVRVVAAVLLAVSVIWLFTGINFFGSYGRDSGDSRRFGAGRRRSHRMPVGTRVVFFVMLCAVLSPLAIDPAATIGWLFGWIDGLGKSVADR